MSIFPTEGRVRLSEATYPYGTATVTVPRPASEADLERLNPRSGGVRLVLDVRESVGDPVRVSEITADHGGSMAALTAAFAGRVADVTAAYFTPWNTETVHGSAARLNLALVARQVDHLAATVQLTAYTDEATAVMYRLLSTTPETSGSLSVRDTVNFALRKIGAALLPGPVDAPIAEPAAIIWQPGVSAWDYMRGVAEAAGLVVRCDPRRRWTLTRRDETRPETVVLDRATRVVEHVDVDTVQTADAVVVRYDWTDPDTGDRRTRFDIASSGETARVVKRIDRSTPYPGPGAARYWLQRLIGRGRSFDVDQVTDYAMRPGAAFTAAFPATPTQLGRIEAVEWDLAAATMTITTTGVADAADGAIDLYPPGVMINDLVGMIADQHPTLEEQ
ncbi:hypothetical protein [Microbacterium soli]